MGDLTEDEANARAAEWFGAGARVELAGEAFCVVRPSMGSDRVVMSTGRTRREALEGARINLEPARPR